jgi:glutamate--cysteine ligase catalytic subunit
VSLVQVCVCVFNYLIYVRPGDVVPVFHPEFGRFMLETTPGKPWGIELQDLLEVERDMRIR